MEDEEVQNAIAAATAKLPAQIKDLREKRGWSQEALAHRMVQLGFTTWRQTTVAKVEAQKSPRALSWQEALGLTFAFGLPGPQYLVGAVSDLPEALMKNLNDHTHRLLEKSAESVRARLEEVGADAETVRAVGEQFGQLGATYAALRSQRSRDDEALEAAVAAYERGELSNEALAEAIAQHSEPGSPEQLLIGTALAAKRDMLDGGDPA